tara:strand:- start:36212 stop:37570 length:1359 start_codon:yes stop_codon:yes gene_type:complete
MPLGETIVALASPPGESAIALIRVSGPLCEHLAQQVFALTSSPRERYATLGYYRGLSGEQIDQVVYLLYPQETSFTGEPMLEIFPHGNPLIVQLLMEDLVARGCRFAEPGEFTRTAFVAGKIDLAQAEAVADLIHARSSKALRNAKKQLSGALGKAVNEFSESLLEAIAWTEAYIDFPEEDLPEEDVQRLLKRIEDLASTLETLAQTSRYRRLLNEGVQSIIVGAPNAGKSSFLNALLGEERALVSDIPGTTRDFISERIMAGPYCINIVDTAGLHDESSGLERLGIEKTLEKMKSADFFLVVIDSANALPDLPEEAWHLFKPTNTLVVENKTDLEGSAICSTFLPDCPHVRISVKTGEGLNAFRETLAKTLESDCIIPDSDTLVVNTRHATALREAKAALESAAQHLRQGLSQELMACELREALEALGAIVGKVDNEAILDKLFGEFCIGK